MQRVRGELSLGGPAAGAAAVLDDFAGARKRLWISNSYFIPDLRLRDAVIERARQGVDVRILVPGNRTDAVPVQLAGRSYYEELLGAGIRIFEYLPAMMHAKTIVVDDAWSVVGSANMDERSMELNAENIVGVAAGDLGPRYRRRPRAGLHPLPRGARTSTSGADGRSGSAAWSTWPRC